ncbi:M23 family metallopeptidase [Citricoccus sp. K5]|uniref:M23 family metallopeptidase n=1 Tax=Citricoccus sp. K5 TaxID=2653135 RepID=UPI0012F20FF2|nr:M23 family metallopeptidase [Citricoccus sp. K5]VXA92080.1 hypothetical protein CITRIK5_100004 [Citricoccus sp. K5]VXA93966.1 hypothetical protein CITRIK5_100070 [Citricoccus sp. K5]
MHSSHRRTIVEKRWRKFRVRGFHEALVELRFAGNGQENLREIPGALDGITFRWERFMPTIDGARLTDIYGYREWRDEDPYLDAYHYGIDIAGVTPNTRPAIFAAANGQVEFVGSYVVPNRNGQHIGIRHPDGTLSFYGHISDPRVSQGQRVGRGQRIATMGNTGTANVHLHFESWVTDQTTHRNPISWLSQYGWSLSGDRLRDTGDFPDDPTYGNYQEDEVLFLYGASKGRVLSGGVFAGVHVSVIEQARAAGIPVISLTDAGHASLVASFGLS